MKTKENLGISHGTNACGVIMDMKQKFQNP